VRWVPAAGEIDHFFDDEPVPGRAAWTWICCANRAVPTKELVPYDTGYLSGTCRALPGALVEAAQRAREAMDAQLMDLCGRQVPETRTGTCGSARTIRRTFKHVLVPVLAHLPPTAGARSRSSRTLYRRPRGPLPESAWKIFFAVLAVLGDPGDHAC